MTEVLEDLCHSLRDEQILESHYDLYCDWLAQNFFLGLQTEMMLGDEPEKLDLESFIQVIIYSLIFFWEAVNRAALLSHRLVSIPMFI